MGAAAVGWRVAVYWPADMAFYSGEIAGYDAASGRHDVAYDDGEEGPLVLGVDRLKWLLAPGSAGAPRPGLQLWGLAGCVHAGELLVCRGVPRCTCGLPGTSPAAVPHCQRPNACLASTHTCSCGAQQDGGR